MGKLPALRSREAIAALEKAGFVLHHVTGSYHTIRHKGNLTLRVTGGGALQYLLEFPKASKPVGRAHRSYNLKAGGKNSEPSLEAPRPLSYIFV